MDIALGVALLALVGTLVNGVVSVFNSRKRRELDRSLMKLQAKLDKLNATELANVQATYAEKLKKLEHVQALETEAGERRRKSDSDNLGRITSVLQPEHVTSFFKQHDFSGTYNREDTKPLYEFCRISKLPGSEFLTPELEEIRCSLVQLANDLANILGYKTHPRNEEFSSVLPEKYLNEVRPDWVDENAQEINECATEFAECYEKLIRNGRKRLEG